MHSFSNSQLQQPGDDCKHARKQGEKKEWIVCNRFEYSPAEQGGYASSSATTWARDARERFPWTGQHEHGRPHMNKRSAHCEDVGDSYAGMESQANMRLYNELKMLVHGYRLNLMGQSVQRQM